MDFDQQHCFSAARDNILIDLFRFACDFEKAAVHQIAGGNIFRVQILRRFGCGLEPVEEHEHQATDPRNRFDRKRSLGNEAERSFCAAHQSREVDTVAVEHFFNSIATATRNLSPGWAQEEP